MSKKKILIVEDDNEIAKSIEIYLRNQNNETVTCANGLEAVKYLDENQVDLILMDVMMPVMNGIEATLRIRENNFTPIIMLTAKSEDIDKITGLNIGADDYITKPFNPMELIARVNSQLRRYTKYFNKSEDEDMIEINTMVLNNKSKEISIDGKIIKMTPIEYKILHLFMSNPNRVFSIDEIYERVWAEPAYNSDTVTVHIRRIREKIEANPKNPEYIKVVWGVGYKLEKKRE